MIKNLHSISDLPVLNRELSWLQFNHRVLQEAEDKRNPLIERMRFLGIYSNNLDEFFRVRVATIRRLIELNQTKSDYLDFNPKQTLEEITKTESGFQKRFVGVFNQLLVELKNEKIVLIDEYQLSEPQGTFVRNYFKTKVRPLLFPIILRDFKDSNWLNDTSIYLGIKMSYTTSKKSSGYAILEVPSEQLSRFIILPSQGDKQFVILLEDAIRFSLDQLFLNFNFDKYEAFTFKITRDAELDLDNDVLKSYIERIEDSVKLRSIGDPVRLVFDREIPDLLLRKITSLLKIKNKEALMPGGRYHNFKDFMDFPDFGKANLVYKPMETLVHPELIDKTSVIDVIAKKDVMIHFPYHTFQHIIDLLREASIDPNVVSIKMTIYRAGHFSNVINALINASRNGKKATVYLELQARFSEGQNIVWTRKLQDAGVKIIHGIPGFKVHAKLILIKRMERKKIKMYANIGTGNFNEFTSSVFSDISLLTSNVNITKEVEMVFNLFESYYKPTKFKTLKVAPFSMRKFAIRMLNREIDNAKLGKEAWAIIKLNNLVDVDVINKLYEASYFGVKLSLIIRGICVLTPGVEGLSENIEAVSIVDRYLEHARVYCFANSGNKEVYITSSDWMIRNFDNRFEVACPIYDPQIKEDIYNILKINLKDNQKTRSYSSDYVNRYKSMAVDEEPFFAQAQTYEFLKRKTKKL